MTEPAAQPVFFVVDEDPAAVETLAGDLERRFQADYRVMGETSAQAALERLGALRDSGEQVALIICAESMRAMPGSELLARSRAAHPDAKRILLIDYSDQRMLDVIARGMALGRVEYYLTKPWRPSEHLLYPVVGEALAAWTRLNSPGFALVRIVGNHWDLMKEIDATPRVRVRLQTEVAVARGDHRLTELVLRDRATGRDETLPAAALFVMIG